MQESCGQGCRGEAYLVMQACTGEGRSSYLDMHISTVRLHIDCACIRMLQCLESQLSIQRHSKTPAHDSSRLSEANNDGRPHSKQQQNGAVDDVYFIDHIIPLSLSRAGHLCKPCTPPLAMSLFADELSSRITGVL